MRDLDAGDRFFGRKRISYTSSFGTITSQIPSISSLSQAILETSFITASIVITMFAVNV